MSQPFDESRSETSFTITYDGPALEANQMPVRDLAPALLAMGEAVNAASRIGNPSRRPPALAIAATQAGSFKIVLELVDATLFERVQDIMVGEGLTSVLNAGELVGWVVGGFTFVKWLRGRKVRNIVELPEPGMIRITDERGNSIDLPARSFELAQDREFRQSAHDVVQPLEEGKVEIVKIQHRFHEVNVTRDEKAAFTVPPITDELVVDEERTAPVRLASIAFNEGNKWRVSEGDLSYWVDIEDESFLRRVRGGVEQFGSGDSLRVRLHTLQWDTADGPKAERTIKEVLEHRQGARQIALPFATDDDVLTDADYDPRD